MHDVLVIPALNDNYIWTIVHPGNQNALIIDPGEAQPVIQLLDEQKLNLAGVLVTHHHWDHTNGINEIVKLHPAPVYAPSADPIPTCDHPLKGGDSITLADMDLTLDVIDIPGHTLGHVAYHNHQWVFTGDTLFAGGCGRLFEGSPDQLYHSLMTLRQLNPDTRVYCGHEYTQKNLQFAKQVEPDNPYLAARLLEVDKRRRQGLPTLPSTIGLERQTNPFLRCDLPAIQQAVEAHYQHTLADTVAVFAALRRWKDEF